MAFMVWRGVPSAFVRGAASGPVGEYFLFIRGATDHLAVILYYFHRLSLVSILADPFVLPAQPA